jgi:hypothetical protein
MKLLTKNKLTPSERNQTCDYAALVFTDDLSREEAASRIAATFRQSRNRAHAWINSWLALGIIKVNPDDTIGIAPFPP